MAFEVARVHGLITQSNNAGEDEAATGHLRKTPMPSSPSLLGRHSASEPTYNFPSEWSYDTYEGIGTAAAAAAGGGQWSQAGSPIETSPCTTETESDEEDLAGLADRLARCTFLSHEDEELLASHLRALSTRGAFGHHHHSVGAAGVNIMNGSPPSSMMVRSSWLTASSETSSRMSSPPSTPLSVVETTDAWEDLLYEAAAQHHHHQQHFHQQQASHLQAMQRVHAQMWAAAALHQHQNITNVANSHQQQSSQRAFPIHINNNPHPRDRMFAPAMQTRNMSPSSASSPKLVVGAHHHPNSVQTYHRSSRCSNSKGLQQQQQTAAGWARHNSNGNGNGRSSCSQSRGNKLAGRMVDPNCTNNRMSLQHNRQQQQQHHQLYPAHVNGGSGMRAVFLGSNGTGRESSGGTGVFLPRTVGSNESKRKSACSTVLLPSRIVQVLNLNVEDMNSMSRPNPASSPPASMVKGNLRSSTPPLVSSSPYPYGTPPATAAAAEVKKVGQNFVQPSVQAPRQVPRASEPCLPTEWTY